MSTSDTHKLNSCDDLHKSTYVYHCRAVLCQDVPQFAQQASNGHLSYFKVLIGKLKVAINIPMLAFVVKWVFNSCVHITKDMVGEGMATRICLFCKKLLTSLLK